MAVTISVVKRATMGNQKVAYVDVTGPASYTTGGELMTAAQQGQITGDPTPAAVDMTQISFFETETEPANLRAMLLDKTNNKMLFTVAGAQVAGAVNLSAVTIRARFTFGGNVG